MVLEEGIDDARLEWLIEDLMVLKEELTLSRMLDARAEMRVLQRTVPERRPQRLVRGVADVPEDRRRVERDDWRAWSPLFFP
jgi:hypothetical protein